MQTFAALQPILNIEYGLAPKIMIAGKNTWLTQFIPSHTLLSQNGNQKLPRNWNFHFRTIPNLFFHSNKCLNYTLLKLVFSKKCQNATHIVYYWLFQLTCWHFLELTYTFLEITIWTQVLIISKSKKLRVWWYIWFFWRGRSICFVFRTILK